MNLIVGIPGINGPGESVADISDTFLNAGRVGKERLKLKHGSDAGGGDSFIAALLKDVDVDKECVESLEAEMFENTDRTGVSGNEQWGLDAGHHQGGWNPYTDAPKLWDGKKREGDEGELKVRLTWN